MSEIIESQQEELHCAQGEELQRRDQQLLHERLLKQNSELREAHHESLNEMKELKKFQSSTFDTFARRRSVEDQDTILELIGKIQELQDEINCNERFKGFSGCCINTQWKFPRYQSTSVFPTSPNFWEIFFLQDVVEKKLTNLANINTKQNKADLMTKCHTSEAHKKVVR